MNNEMDDLSMQVFTHIISKGQSHEIARALIDMTRRIKPEKWLGVVLKRFTEVY